MCTSQYSIGRETKHLICMALVSVIASGDNSPYMYMHKPYAHDTLRLMQLPPNLSARQCLFNIWGTSESVLYLLHASFMSVLQPFHNYLFVAQ